MKKITLIIIGLILSLMLMSCNKNKLTIIIDYDNGSEQEIILVEYKKQIANFQEPTKENHEFKGLYEGDIFFDIKTVITRDYHLIAKWKLIDEQQHKNVEITLVLPEGYQDEIIVLESGKKLIIDILIPEIEGKIFLGWYFNDELFNFDNEIKENLKLVARYRDELIINKYQVKFIFNNGKEDLLLSVNEYDQITVPKEPTLDGYTFQGWYYNGSKFNFDTQIEKNMILEAKWEKVLSNKEKIINAYQYHNLATNFEVVGLGNASGKAFGITINQDVNLFRKRENNDIEIFNSSFGKGNILTGGDISKYIYAKGQLDDIKLFSNKNTIGNPIPTNFPEEDQDKNINSNRDIDKIYANGVNSIKYLMNEETILTVEKQEIDTYYVIFDLEKSINHYKNNIVKMNPKATIKESIKFSKVEALIKLDLNGYFKEIEYFEEYEITVTEPIKTTSKVTGYIKESFNYH